MDEELPSRLEIELSVEDRRFADAIPELPAFVRQVLETALAEADARAHIPPEVGVRLVDDPTIRALNARFRGHDRPTDVLSFPTLEPAAVAAALAADHPVPLGDIVVSYDTVARDAAGLGRPFADHLAHILVHGLLHLLGHDHEEDEEAARMESLERRILARLGLSDPYADEVPS